jgi:hypothetical protein
LSATWFATLTAACFGNGMMETQKSKPAYRS